VKAMIDGVDGAAMPELKRWIADAAIVNSSARDGSGGEDQWRRAVEENVLDQLANLTTYPCVQTALAAGAVKLHGWVYDLRGELRVYDDEDARFEPAR
jgi:carbonic anhydrase